jgi:methyl-accepting chemotaxis protein
MDNQLTVFIAVTAAAVVLQLIILIALFVAMRQTAKKVESIATELHGRALPLIDSVQSAIDANRAHVDTIIANTADTSKLVKSQLERVDATITDVTARVRARCARADDMVERTMDSVEHAGQTVRRTVDIPVRHINGVLQAVAVAVSTLIGRRPNGRVVQKEDHFI